MAELWTGRGLGRVCAFAAALLCVLCAPALAEEPDCVIDVGGSTAFCSIATFSADLPERSDAAAMSLVVAHPPEGCEPQAAVSPGSVMLVSRGNCSFVTKARYAAAAGASAVVVRNTLKGMYLSATNMSAFNPTLQVSPCDYDCTLGTIAVQASHATPAYAYNGYSCGGACTSGMCVLDGTVNTGGSHQACCMLDDLMTIGGSWPVGEPTLPVVFINVDEGADVFAQASGGQDPAVRIYMRPLAKVDISVAAIWVLGCGAAFVATWRSSLRERRAISAARRGTSPTRASQSSEPVQMAISLPQAVAFLCCASVMLLVLYLLIQAGFKIVIIIVIVFSLGATSSTTQMVWAPLIARLRPSCARRSVKVWQLGDVTHAQIGGFFSAVSLVAFWLYFRHESWAWVLQDFFGIALCSLFVLTLRLPSLRVATGLLVLFFVYDIFMVFITPYIFKTSVMVEVATAGLPAQFANRDCYCRLNPDDSLCEPAELMPILIMFPRLSSWKTGYSMLGLGDVAIPGMLLSYLLRWDLLNHQRVRWGYYWFAVIGYCIGLFMAMAAVIIMELGQPALLYLVPMTLVPTFIIASRRGELGHLWRGKNLGAERRDRHEPLVQASQEEEGVALTSMHREASHDDAGASPSAQRGAVPADATHSGVIAPRRLSE